MFVRLLKKTHHSHPVYFFFFYYYWEVEMMAVIMIRSLPYLNAVTIRRRVILLLLYVAHLKAADIRNKNALEFCVREKKVILREKRDCSDSDINKTTSPQSLICTYLKISKCQNIFQTVHANLLFHHTLKELYSCTWMSFARNLCDIAKTDGSMSFFFLFRLLPWYVRFVSFVRFWHLIVNAFLASNVETNIALNIFTSRAMEKYALV